MRSLRLRNAPMRRLILQTGSRSLPYADAALSPLILVDRSSCCSAMLIVTRSFPVEAGLAGISSHASTALNER
jgi:4-diphosphocytidyl-2C-methyl-D-erythritol kinase